MKREKELVGVWFYYDGDKYIGENNNLFYNRCIKQLNKTHKDLSNIKIVIKQGEDIFQLSNTYGVKCYAIRRRNLYNFILKIKGLQIKTREIASR